MSKSGHTLCKRPGTHHYRLQYDGRARSMQRLTAPKAPSQPLVGTACTKVAVGDRC